MPFKIWFFLCFTVVVLASFGLCQSQDESKQDNGELVFIGKGSTKLYFTLLTTHGLDWNTGFSYCNFRGFRPGNIQTEADLTLITSFLNSTTELPGNRSFWVAATDHLVEGQYQWLVNREEVRVGTWGPGMPSGNRSLNCLALNSNGEWTEGHCTNGIHRYFLCESPMERYAPSSSKVEPLKAGLFEVPTAKFGGADILAETRNLTPIGGVGNKLYFLNDEFGTFMQGLDICHEAGMQLVSPETPVELDYVRGLMQEHSILLVLPVWDALSVSCLQSNAEYQWFYSGNAVNQTDPDLNGHGSWYQCILLTPTAFRTYSCTSFTSSIICELNTDANP